MHPDGGPCRRCSRARGSDARAKEVIDGIRNGDQACKETQMSKLGDELVQSMAEALAHAQGKRIGVRVHSAWAYRMVSG
jgi:hypothetical protein